MYIITYVEKADFEQYGNEEKGFYGRPHKYYCESQEDVFSLWFQLTHGGTNDGCKPLFVKVYGDDLIEYDPLRGLPLKPKDK